MPLGSGRARVGALLIVGALLLGVACVKPPTGPPLPTTTATPPPKTNVVRILTDDQDITSVAVMAKAQQLLAAKGVTYTQASVSLSLCCPSRATHLTGQYTHNHNVWDNYGTTGGYEHFAQPENSLAPWLQASGYKTAHVGKYMNGYAASLANQVPPGWDDWFTIIDPASEAYPYYNYSISDNGTTRAYGAADTDYLTDVFADRAVSTLHTMATSGQPFFLDYWPTAPHYGKGRNGGTALGPAVAPKYESANPGVRAPRTNNYRPAVNGIPQGLREIGAATEALFPPDQIDQILDDTYRDYVNSLLSVDDSIERLVNELQASGQLDNTLIIFTSDNGYMWGNHGLYNFKWEPYEESVRVPLIMRGPGIPQGVTSNRPVSNIDIVPTILQATGVLAGRVVDGKAMLPYATDPNADQDRAVLIESTMFDPTSNRQFTGPYDVPRFKAVRTNGFQYTEWFDGFVELFDLQSDPTEMHNLADDPNYAANRSLLAAAVAQLATCAGANCQVSVPGLTHPGPSSSAPNQGASGAAGAGAVTPAPMPPDLWQALLKG
jgi:N-acetylglucosamine-6-sulfatase